MTDINYPPGTTWTLGAAAADVADQIDELETTIANADEDVRMREERSELATRETQRDALRWAAGEWGDDAEITLEAYTAGHRARVIDELNQTTMGSVGAERAEIWLLGGAIKRAPWLDGDESIADSAELVRALPPALADWLNEQLDDLGDLSKGN